MPIRDWESGRLSAWMRAERLMRMGSWDLCLRKYLVYDDDGELNRIADEEFRRFVLDDTYSNEFLPWHRSERKGEP